MKKYAVKGDDGQFREAKEVEIVKDGKSIGWVSPEMAVDWHRGLISNKELLQDASKKVLPSSNVLVHWDKKMYPYEEEE